MNIVDICFVGPSFRRQGVGSLLMAYWTNKVEEMVWESYVDANEMESRIAELMDIGHRKNWSFTPGIRSRQSERRRGKGHHEKSAKLKDVERELLPFAFWPMWRPKYGKIDSCTITPWRRVSCE